MFDLGQLGLTAADRRVYSAALAQPHRMRSIIKVRDRDERIISSWTSETIMISGSVQVDMNQYPTRQLDLQILKPGARTSWSPNAPDDAAIFADNFISATRGIYVDGLGQWVDVPVFWGPITSASDDGDQLSINAVGKEVRGLVPHRLWKTMKIGASTTRVQGIRDVLDEIGETRYGLPVNGSKMGKTRNLSRYNEPWMTAIDIGQGFPSSRQVFYDGDGRVRLRMPPSNRAWVLRPGDNSMMLSKPKLDYNIAEVRNVVEVRGVNPAGKRPRIRAVAYAPSWHPLSAGPNGLGRNGKPTYLVEPIENDMTTTKAARDLAQKMLLNYLIAGVNIQVDAMVIPHLEGSDIVGVEVNGHVIDFRMKQFTIPLAVTDPMTLGANKRVSWRKKVKK